MYSIDEIKDMLPDLEPHPAASKLPMMHGEELSALILDLANNGMRNKIWIVGNQILDGRSRYAALRNLKSAGKLTFIPDIAEWLNENDDLDSVVLSMNVHRNHYSKQQLAVYAARNLMSNLKQEAILRMHKKVPTELFPEVNKGTANSLAASLVGTNEKYVQWACKIKSRNEYYLDFVMQKQMSLQEGLEFIEMKAEERGFFFERMKAGKKFKEAKAENEKTNKPTSNSSDSREASQSRGSITETTEMQSDEQIIAVQPAEQAGELSQNVDIEGDCDSYLGIASKHDPQDKLKLADEALTILNENITQDADMEFLQPVLGIMFPIPRAISHNALEEIKVVLHKHGYSEPQYKVVTRRSKEEI